jgi:flagellar motor component MotA
MPVVINKISKKEDVMQRIKRIISVIGILGMVVIVMKLNGLSVYILLNLEAIFLVFGTAMFIAIRELKPRTICNGFISIVWDARKKEADPKGLRIFQENFASWAFLGAHIGAILAYIQILASLADPSTLGPAVASLVINYLYAGVFAAIMPHDLSDKPNSYVKDVVIAALIICLPMLPWEQITNL